MKLLLSPKRLETPPLFFHCSFSCDLFPSSYFVIFSFCLEIPTTFPLFQFQYPKIRCHTTFPNCPHLFLQFIYLFIYCTYSLIFTTNFYPKHTACIHILNINSHPNIKQKFQLSHACSYK